MSSVDEESFQGEGFIMEHSRQAGVRPAGPKPHVTWAGASTWGLRGARGSRVASHRP